MPAKTATKEAKTDNVIEAEVAVPEPQPGQIVEVRHVLRNLGPENNQRHNVTAYADIDQHLSMNYLQWGWELLASHHIKTVSGQEMGGLTYNVTTMLYILGRRAA